MEGLRSICVTAVQLIFFGVSSFVLAAGAQPRKPDTASPEGKGLDSVRALQGGVTKATAAPAGPQAETERERIVVMARAVLEDIWLLHVGSLSGEQKLLSCYTAIRALAAAEEVVARLEDRKAIRAVRSEAETLAQAYDGRSAAFATLYDEGCWYYWRGDYPSAMKRLRFILALRDASARRPALATLAACYFKTEDGPKALDALFTLGLAREGDSGFVLQGVYVAALELLGRGEYEKGRVLLTSIRAVAPDERTGSDAVDMLQWVDKIQGAQNVKGPK